MIEITRVDIDIIKSSDATFENILMLQYLREYGFDISSEENTIDRRLKISESKKMPNPKELGTKIGFMIGNGGVSNQSTNMNITPIDGKPSVVEWSESESIIIIDSDMFLKNHLPMKYCDYYSGEYDPSYCFNKPVHINGEFYQKFFGKLASVSFEVIPDTASESYVKHTYISCHLTKDEMVAVTSSLSGMDNQTKYINEFCLFFGKSVSNGMYNSSRIVNGKPQIQYEILDAVPFYKMEFAPIHLNEIPDSGLMFCFDMFDNNDD